MCLLLIELLAQIIWLLDLNKEDIEMSRLLICKDATQNKLLETKILKETDNIIYSIIDDAPAIEERENEIGRYVLDDSGEVAVVYEEIPKSETEVLKQRVSELEETIMVLSSNI